MKKQYHQAKAVRVCSDALLIRAFDDIYKFGIKGAAQDAGAYAERIDEQIFTEGILDRVFNQINKADVIVADMTGRNANVFLRSWIRPRSRKDCPADDVVKSNGIRNV